MLRFLWKDPQERLQHTISLDIYVHDLRTALSITLLFAHCAHMHRLYNCEAFFCCAAET